jgi:hypothetical protein
VHAAASLCWDSMESAHAMEVAPIVYTKNAWAGSGTGQVAGSLGSRCSDHARELGKPLPQRVPLTQRPLGGDMRRGRRMQSH